MHKSKAKEWEAVSKVDTCRKIPELLIARLENPPIKTELLFLIMGLASASHVPQGHEAEAIARTLPFYCIQDAQEPDKVQRGMRSLIPTRHHFSVCSGPVTYALLLFRHHHLLFKDTREVHIITLFQIHFCHPRLRKKREQRPVLDTKACCMRWIIIKRRCSSAKSQHKRWASELIVRHAF